MNKISHLLRKPFSQHSLEDKMFIIRLGPPQPTIGCHQDSSMSRDRGRCYMRHFRTGWYFRFKWLCGCEEKAAVFCFPCVLFGGERRWTMLGFDDWKHLSSRLHQHQQSQAHRAAEYQLDAFVLMNSDQRLNEDFGHIEQKPSQEEISSHLYLSGIMHHEAPSNEIESSTNDFSKETWIGEEQTIKQEAIEIFEVGQSDPEDMQSTPPLLPDTKKAKYDDDLDTTSYNHEQETKDGITNRNEYSIYGELVGEKLRKCSENCLQEVTIAQHKINNILFELEMEWYKKAQRGHSSSTNRTYPPSACAQAQIQPAYVVNTPNQMQQNRASHAFPHSLPHQSMGQIVNKIDQ